jgi:C1A family cysteine protease
MKRRFVLSILCASLGLAPWLAGQPTPTVIPANPASAAPQPDAKAFEVISKVWTTPFKSQGRTATCWSFSTTSFLESEAHRLGRGDFELSPVFTVYHA